VTLRTFGSSDLLMRTSWRKAKGTLLTMVILWLGTPSISSRESLRVVSFLGYLLEKVLCANLPGLALSSFKQEIL
jgi:hypothetical protein